MAFRPGAFAQGEVIAGFIVEDEFVFAGISEHDQRSGAACDTIGAVRQ